MSNVLERVKKVVVEGLSVDEAQVVERKILYIRPVISKEKG